MENSDIITHLSAMVGKKNMLIDPDSKKTYGSDLTQRYTPNPLAIVFPRKEQEVVNIVQLANAAHFTLVPSGGRTGYSGGAVAASGEVVVSFEKMNKITDFNAHDRTVKCEPGVITQALQHFAEQHHLFYPVDFASSGSSHIAGNIATNAGGIKVMRYGLTRNFVLGLRVVTGNGDLLDLNHGLIKNACGYDLMQLFIGSEGTLGFITEATMKLIESPPFSNVMLMALSNKHHCLEIQQALRSMREITAFEFFTDRAIHYVLKDTSLMFPFSKRSSFYVLIEYDTSPENDEKLLSLTDLFIKNRWANEMIISSNIEQAKNLWRLREMISMSLRKYLPYKYDIAVIPSKIIAFMEDVDAILSAEKIPLEAIWFGHMGDGNLHLNILKPDGMSVDKFFEYGDHDLGDRIYSLIEAYQGSISAEHGIGLLKKDFLHYTKSKTEISHMRDIKKIFDRNNVMNPFKLMSE